MDKLLEALRKGDRTAINIFAMELLVTKDKHVNKPEANAFEHYAPCTVREWSESTIFANKCYIGTIIYNGVEYGFGWLNQGDHKNE